MRRPRAGPGAAAHAETSLRRRDALVRAFDDEGGPAGPADGSTGDRRHARYDAVTGLPDRTLLHDHLEQAQERVRKGATGDIAVVVLDVDRFGLVNDALGHAAGDRLLAQLARRLSSVILPGETLARSGDDEFAVVVEGRTPSEAHDLARRLLDVLAVPFTLEGRVVDVSACTGVATSGLCPPDELLRSAGAALSRAKRRGPGGSELFDPSHATAARTRFDLGVELRPALAARQLEVWYQPIVELAGGRLLGVEALARWDHPARGRVGPELFVSIAEDQGFVGTLDRWVLSTAATDLAELRSLGHVAPEAFVSVNISALDLGEGTLHAAVTEAARSAGLPPACLCLEVTETAVMADPGVAAAVLTRLAGDGFGVALDDFGTGHSSLAYLRDLPVSSLKIDRSFVVDAAHGGTGRVICASVVALCRELGIRAVAEGVETRAEHDTVLGLGCPAAQGYRYGRPMPKQALVAHLATSPPT